MEQETPLEISDYAYRRMSRRCLSVYHIWYVRFHHEREYKVGDDTVWMGKLPDGRNVKVRVGDTNSNPIIVNDAFTYQ
jgi:hypothetical protein